jgi:uncharacterized membrane protein
MKRAAIRLAIVPLSTVLFGVPPLLTGSWIVWLLLPPALLAGAIFGTIAAALPSRLLVQYISPPWWKACIRAATGGCAAAMLSSLMFAYGMYPLHEYPGDAKRILSADLIPTFLQLSSAMVAVGGVCAMLTIPILRIVGVHEVFSPGTARA